MRTLVHLSDIHFGRVDDRLLAPLRATVEAVQPHVVVVSGDLTQRARSAQFQAARAWLDTLPQPQIVVPGNHDIPLYNVAARFLTPLTKYRRYITPNLAPEYVDDEIAVMGLNTARSLTIKDGRVNRDQVARLQERMAKVDQRLTRIVVTHHPFDLPEQFDEDDLVDRAPMAMEAFARCGVDLLLAGHLHASHSGNSARRYKIAGYAALVVQAGTATSTRGRGETNSFNVLRIDQEEIQVERYGWKEETGAFEVVTIEVFRRAGNSWQPLGTTPDMPEAITSSETVAPQTVSG
ncbi:3',5'-cyclic AMP phosphodiesterase CpdA [Pseudoduganella flava]|uniref:3',5'-cyclic AMP phosphodiesterase CpdA n=1 Tax=Pseudoduganella flava TaxID=871742 RepID=A0A562PK64_9BURK|nr:metallophosphoesterase family protein [Pseudoduganella flava]QGZ42003.1 metallophosphoesterase [Pseudoduganella flava]TWI44416.1 3',5'-cyclic AMP phosphodiesterase CpdA [Pseudoduganella flava]